MNGKQSVSIDWQNPDWEQIARDMMAEFDLTEADSRNRAKQHKERVDFCIQFINARCEKKLTQAQLAEKAGVTQAMIARLEGGKVNTTYQTLTRVAEVLDRQVILAKTDLVQ